MTDRYAVVGNPVAHSLSPEIHAVFARQTGQDLEYARLPAPLDGFAATVDQFRASGGCGVNVTVPFKFDAFKYCEPAASALAAEAANTLDFRAGKIRGYNTDGSGLITDLEHNLGFTICGQRVLVMGAGGATSGVVHPLLDAQRPVGVVYFQAEAFGGQLALDSHECGGCIALEIRLCHRIEPLMHEIVFRCIA